MVRRGWFPDPGGYPGMFRYWDGSGWSEALSSTPAAPPPTFVYSPGGDPVSPGQAGQDAYEQFTSMPKTRRPVGLWVLVGVLIVAVVLVVYLGVRTLGGGGGDVDPTGGIPTSTTSVCPDRPDANVRAEHPVDDRVHGGRLSYPRLGSPWNPESTHETRVPFGRDVANQKIYVHRNDTGEGGWNSWVASILVGELYAGDGFYSPQEGSQIVNTCIFGTFYGDAEVGSQTLRSEPYTLDGYDGWITVTNLTFSIPNLPTTSALVTVIIIDTGGMSASLFFSAIPGDTPQYNADVDTAIAGLHVET